MEFGEEEQVPEIQPVSVVSEVTSSLGRNDSEWSRMQKEALQEYEEKHELWPEVQEAMNRGMSWQQACNNMTTLLKKYNVEQIPSTIDEEAAAIVDHLLNKAPFVQLPGTTGLEESFTELLESELKEQENDLRKRALLGEALRVFQQFRIPACSGTVKEMKKHIEVPTCQQQVEVIRDTFIEQKYSARLLKALLRWLQLHHTERIPDITASPVRHWLIEPDTLLGRLRDEHCLKNDQILPELWQHFAFRFSSSSSTDPQQQPSSSQAKQEFLHLAQQAHTVEPLLDALLLYNFWANENRPHSASAFYSGGGQDLPEIESRRRGTRIVKPSLVHYILNNYSDVLPRLNPLIQQFTQSGP